MAAVEFLLLFKLTDPAWDIVPLVWKSIVVPAPKGALVMVIPFPYEAGVLVIGRSASAGGGWGFAGFS